MRLISSYLFYPRFSYPINWGEWCPWLPHSTELRGFRISRITNHGARAGDVLIEPLLPSSHQPLPYATPCAVRSPLSENILRSCCVNSRRWTLLTGGDDDGDGASGWQQVSPRPKDWQWFFWRHLLRYRPTSVVFLPLVFVTLPVWAGPELFP